MFDDISLCSISRVDIAHWPILGSCVAWWYGNPNQCMVFPVRPTCSKGLQGIRQGEGQRFFIPVFHSIPAEVTNQEAHICRWQEQVPSWATLVDVWDWGICVCLHLRRSVGRGDMCNMILCVSTGSGTCHTFVHGLYMLSDL